MSAPSPSSPAERAAAVLAAGSHRDRIRTLRKLRGNLSRELAEEFRERAHGNFRRDPAEGRRVARLGVLVARDLEDVEALAACYRAEGQAALMAGAFAAAERAFARARLASPDDDERTGAELDALRMHALLHQERYAEARQLAGRALETFERLGDMKGVVRTRMALADLEFRQERPRQALDQYLLVETIFPDASPRFRALLAMNRANALEARNRFRAAERQFAMARRIFAELGFDHSVAQIDYNAAYAAGLRGRYEDALRGLESVEERFRDLGDERHLAHTDLDRAEFHLVLNMAADALAHADTAERRFQDLGLEKEAGQAALWAGRAAELGGELEAAEERYRRAAEVFHRLDLHERRLAALTHQAHLAEQRGRHEEAELRADEAESLLDRNMNPLSGASIELLRARLDLRRGDADGARRRAEQVRTVCHRIHAPWVTIEAHRVLGRAHRANGRTEEAIAHYRDAIETLEEYRGGVPPDEYMTAFLAGRTDLYEEIVDLLVTRGEKETAFEFAERARSRALIDLIGDRSGSATGPDLTATRMRHLREQLNAVYHRLFRRGDGSEARSARAVLDAQRRASRLEHEISLMLRRSRLAARPADRTIERKIPGLVEIRHELEPDTQLVEFYLTSTTLYTFLVDRRVLKVFSLDVGEGELRRHVSRFFFHLGQIERSHVAGEDLVLAATRANLRELSRILLDPIVEHLDHRRLAIVPHGVLHQLPFHALPMGDGWVADRHEVLIAPSAAVYVMCGEDVPRDVSGASVLGLPDEAAPSIEDEARSVARKLDGRLFLGGRATLRRMRREARRSRVLHIATHGMFRPSQPMLSAIRLADGWMNLYDLCDIEVHAELVVLSTCESGTAGVSEGDEILGLTRGFLFAGARALMTSQWRVHDAVTTQFMDAFYGFLRLTGDVASSHRSAMAVVRRRYPHPYFWAPFSLTGRPVPRAVPGEEEPETTLVEATVQTEGIET